MAKRRVRRHRRGPSVRGITINRRNNPGMALSPTVLMGIGILVIGGAAAYYFLSKSSSGGSSSPSGTDAYGNPVDSQGNVAEQPQLPSEEPTATTPEIVIPANVTPVATPANTPTGTQPRRVTLAPSTTQPSSTWTPAAQPSSTPSSPERIARNLAANEKRRLERLASTPYEGRPRFQPDGTMSIAEYERYEKLPDFPDNTKNRYTTLLTPAQNEEFWKTHHVVIKARYAAKDAVATANYEREAGAALMPIAIYAIYKNSQAEFDKNLPYYRSYTFYSLLRCACRIMGVDFKLTDREDGSPAAKAFRLKLAKDLGALWARSKERATIKNKDGKTVEIFKLLVPAYNDTQKG